MALWGGLGQAATVAQLVGADIGGLITMIMQAAMTAQQNKKECEQLARRIFTIAELLQHLQDPEVLRRPEIRRPLTGLDDTLREAHELVLSCQDKSAVYRLVMAGRQAEKFRDVQSRIDSYLLLFPDTAKICWNWKEPHGVQEFNFKELAKATKNFAPERKIGEGSFGSVYMGRLPDGRVVAIKHRSRNSLQGYKEFMAEITILSPIHYKHIVPLYGYCDVLVEEKQRRLLPPFRKEKEEKEHLLVYEYMENGSLDHHLHGPTSSSSSSSPVMASWKTRMEILLGVSRAIEYLQSCGEQPIIHRDIKTSNILLDGNWVPRLTDFGLALTWEGPGHEEAVVGTYRYVAPEYVMTGVLNPSVDIYGFGVVMLEVLTAKRPYYPKEESEEKKREDKREECEEEVQKREEWEKEDTTQKLHEDLRKRRDFVSFVLPLIEEGNLRKVLDRRPSAEPTPRQLQAVELVAQTAARCLRLQWEERPAILEVVANLETALELARCDG
uniref:Protein kinase domain-containing protein n=1 Tax=Oryza rufipogon TaxID=4529 RepID=A0A0E0RBV3_ORYRU